MRTDLNYYSRLTREIRAAVILSEVSETSKRIICRSLASWSLTLSAIEKKEQLEELSAKLIRLYREEMSK